MKTKKELKEEYKQLKAPMGVFQIKNVSNNKVLIDNSPDMTSKWNRHKTELRFGSHRNSELQKDWNEKGEENFVFEVLSELENKGEENVDYRKELRELQDMIVEELGVTEDRLYRDTYGR
ncbi:MAG: GIY-YIG nuclease family protein [Ignavibacteriae bacterium]|nr:GIY-YIG nuclease family protein [Ignavibacteriota bacterium]MCB9216717.1 GIY-YIG nuclease family protein [Ignavibacteria bacterium]